MSKQTINIGASPNDGTGTPLRTSFDYTNQNFTELYTALGGGVGLPGATTQVIFNDGGTNLAGDAGLVYNKTTDALTVAGLVTAGSATITGNLTVDTNTLFVNSTTDRVGIATASPAEKLTIDNTLGAGAIGLRVFANDQSTARMGVHNTNGQSWQFVAGYAGANNQGLSIFDATTSANRLYLDTSGNANIINGNLILGTSGKGIDFSATAGTGTSEILADYEEGVWSPAVSGEVNLTSTTFVSARYTKIGRVVTVSGSVTTFIITSNTLAYFALQNLPFTAATVVPGPLWNDTRNTSGTTQVSGNILYGFLSAASGTTSGSAMTLYFSNTYTV
jgi:hypothetical protein